MNRHKHADLIVPWANGARIQLKTKDGWVDTKTPDWYEDFEYRIAPQATIKIGDREVPEPLRVAPEEGTTVWGAALTNPAIVFSLAWSNCSANKRILARGLLHLTEAAARAHAEALLALSAPQHESKSDD